MGLDDWPISHSTEIAEERLLLSAQSILGPQVTRFLTPPRGPESVGAQTNWFDESRQIGVPVAPFPRWMVCSRVPLAGSAQVRACSSRRSTPTDQTEPATFTTARRRDVRRWSIPARFLVTCDRGHLDDFPWLEFVHRGPTDCNGPLRMYEFGPSGEMADVTIVCDKCEKRRRLAEVIGPIGSKNMPPL